VLATVAADDLWIADRHCCTRAFLCELDTRGSFFVIRQHQGLPFERLSGNKTFITEDLSSTLSISSGLETLIVQAIDY
jgi:hypothetical protein